MLNSTIKTDRNANIFRSVLNTDNDDSVGASSSSSSSSSFSYRRAVEKISEQKYEARVPTKSGVQVKTSQKDLEEELEVIHRA
jgi:hypothetical protein